MTQRAILEAIRGFGELSRAEVARHTGISATTISKGVESLLRAGILEESAAEPHVVGRPGKRLHLATRTAQVLGMVLDVKRCTVVAAGLNGQLHAKRSFSFATPPTYEALLEALVHQAKRLMSNRRVRTLGVGLTVPGLVDRRQGRCVSCINLSLLNGRKPAADLRELLRIESAMLPDSDALCLAEHSYGAAKGLSHFAVIHLIEGLGLGVFNDGKLLEGHCGFAGELGHMTVDPNGALCACGNHGCLETVATDAALVREVSKKMGRVLDIEEMIALMQAGELEATAEIDRTLEYLAVGVGEVINLFNPAAVLIQGRFFDVKPGLFDRLVYLIRRRALLPSLEHCVIRRGSCGMSLGAVAGILNHLFHAFGPKFQSTSPSG
jgi:N-acetylglucosamine repressor